MEEQAVLLRIYKDGERQAKEASAEQAEPTATADACPGCPYGNAKETKGKGKRRACCKRCRAALPALAPAHCGKGSPSSSGSERALAQLDLKLDLDLNLNVNLKIMSGDISWPFDMHSVILLRMLTDLLVPFHQYWKSIII